MAQYTTPLVAAQPMNVSSLTPPKSLDECKGYAIQAVYTGSSIDGTLYLQVSCDPFQNDTTPDPTHFAILANSSAEATGAGVYIWNIGSPFYNWVQVGYTDASGGTSNGSLTVSISAKDIK